MARKLSHEYKVSARTSATTYQDFNLEILRAATDGQLKFRGRKLGVEAAMNAILIDFLRRPERERRQILADGVAQFERLLEGEPPPTSAPEAQTQPPRRPLASGAKPRKPPKQGEGAA